MPAILCLLSLLRPQRWRCGVLLTVLVFGATASQAQRLEAPPAPDLGAVGWLEREGTAYCTATLIAPDRVLTAAHCLHDPETGQLLPPGDIGFLAAWRDGQAAVRRRGARAMLHPDYDASAPRAAGSLRNDLALLALQWPVPASAVAPLRIGAHPGTGAEVTLVTALPDAAPLPQPDCQVLSRQDSVLVLSCPVEAGASGAPILGQGPEGWRVVSVVAARARAEGRAVALGTDLSDPVDWLLPTLTLPQAMPASAPIPRDETPDR